MHVIGHDHEGVTIHAGKPLWKGLPCLTDSLACLILMHCAIDDLPKEASSIMSTDGDEVRARLAVVVSL